MFLNMSPPKRLSRAFCTEGSFNKGGGAAAVGVTGSGVEGTLSADLFKMFIIRL